MAAEMFGEDLLQLTGVVACLIYSTVNPTCGRQQLDSLFSI